jgi:single-stranded-DNA-specific exonuclease
LADLSPPEGLPDLDRATERLARAIRAGERIAVCGDYDVDGMTGTALLVRFFRLAGGNVTWSIPHREKDGYGLSSATIERLAADGVKVAVTVDNGSTAVEPIKRAVELGIDVVITDHHIADGELPPAYAIVNPQLPGGSVAAQDLCGCGLAFKVAWAIADRLRGRGVNATELKAFLRDAMGLVAMATVCDVVPLVGENRTLVATGLAALRKSPHPGIQALLEVSDLGRLPLTTEDVGFKLGPRLNAAGRLSRPDLVVDLLTGTDPVRCQALAQELDQANRTRRQVEEGVLKQADAQAAELVSARNPSALVLWGEGWHVGVVGIVAARMVDKYHRPAAVIGFADGRGRGSCRTPPAFNVHAALGASAEHLESFGGHAAAAGLDIRIDRAPAFRAAFEDAVVRQLENTVHQRTLEIDLESHADEWDLDTMYAVRRLAPFGRSNPEPLVIVRGAEVAGKPKLMGQASTHLTFALKQAQGAIRVVGFRQAKLFDLAASGTPLDLAVTPVINEWRGMRSPEFRLVDMRAAAT